jgi:hypothetical protein
LNNIKTVKKHVKLGAFQCETTNRNPYANMGLSHLEIRIPKGWGAMPHASKREIGIPAAGNDLHRFFLGGWPVEGVQLAT